MSITAENLIKNGIEEVTTSDLEKRYCDMLDDVYPDLSIAGLGGYQTSRVLASADPIAFRCGLSDFISLELGETLEEVDGKYFDIDDVKSFSMG